MRDWEPGWMQVGEESLGVMVSTGGQCMTHCICSAHDGQERGCWQVHDSRTGETRQDGIAQANATPRIEI